MGRLVAKPVPAATPSVDAQQTGDAIDGGGTRAREHDMGGIVGLILLALFFSNAVYGERQSAARMRQELDMIRAGHDLGD